MWIPLILPLKKILFFWVFTIVVQLIEASIWEHISYSPYLKKFIFKLTHTLVLPARCYSHRCSITLFSYMIFKAISLPLNGTLSCSIKINVSQCVCFSFQFLIFIFNFIFFTIFFFTLLRWEWMFYHKYRKM